MTNILKRENEIGISRAKFNWLAAVLMLCSVTAILGQSTKGGALRLGNKFVVASWKFADGKFRAVGFEDLINKKKLALPADVFTLVLKDGTTIRSSEMRLEGSVHTERLQANKNASRLSEHLGGTRLVVNLASMDGRVSVEWSGVLRDGSQYIRQEITIAPTTDLPISEIRLIDLDAPGARVVGMVKGSPVVAGNLYFGFEHPLSESRVDGSHVKASIKRELPLRKGTKVTYSSVVGATRIGQLRRDFLTYVERERAHPYRTFLHYNSWYDIGYFTPYTQKEALDVIEQYGKHLVQERGVKMDSFLFDDGWDDYEHQWAFNSGFPNGFAPLRAAAEKYGAEPGMWLSPWGGYGKPLARRVAGAKAAGYEVNVLHDDAAVDVKKTEVLALSGPKYFKRFHEVTSDLLTKYGINQFKLDGTGDPNRAYPGSSFDSDFAAAISLIDNLRAIKPSLYINLTTGTWPSPFWLHYADSIWRGGDDHSFAGVGTKRQQWITYRDSDLYEGVVQKGPLYPLNSLMLHGLIYAKHANNLDTDPNGDFIDEVHDYFGTGTQLQEMYVTPALLKSSDWDVIAEAAKWSRTNADILVDTHWVGGDPRKLDVYGFASWSPRKGILTLRNPSDKPQSISVDIADIFELPAAAEKVYSAHSPWAADAKDAAITLRAGEKYTFELKPFQVISLEMIPRKR